MLLDLPNFLPVMPEIFMLVMTCIVLLVGLYSRQQQAVYYLTQLALIGAAALTLQGDQQLPVITLYNMFVLDKLAVLSKLVIYAVSFLSFLYARKYIQVRGISSVEFYVLGLFAVLGMMVMVSAHNLLVLFLGLELLSLPLYAMVAMRRGVGDAAEGAMKYFVMGALASGMLLYGLSMLYGATRTLDIAELSQAIAILSGNQFLIMVLGVVFVVAGLAFKFGAAPFHMWAPDVYQSAPTPVTLFISSAPKIAVLMITFRLLSDAMSGLYIQWQQLFIIVAIVSMGLGNIVAIIQSNIKRMLAYSAIAHMGFVVLGLLAATPEGYAAALFYMIAYAIMSAGAFAVLVMLSSTGIDIEDIDDLRGLNNRNPWLAFMMLIVMFSMAGIPPTVGFFAKLAVLKALVDINMVWLAIVALVFAIIGVYYYIRVVKAMYFDAPETTLPITSSFDMRCAVSINALLLLGLGIFPGALIQVCRTAFG